MPLYVPLPASIASAGTTTIANGGTGATSAVAALDALTAVSTNIAAAATTDLSTATGVNVTITGTATITALGTSPVGTIRRCTFTANGSLITHNATSLFCPGAVSFYAGAGDTIEFYSLGSGNWRVANWFALGATAGFGAYIQMQSNGGVLGINGATIPLAWNATNVILNQPTLAQIRFQTRQDSSIASAATITLLNQGNVFPISGTTAINSITTTGWQAGSVILLIFATGAAVQVTTAGNIRPRTGVAQTTTPVGAAATLYAMELVFDGTNWIQPA